MRIWKWVGLAGIVGVAAVGIDELAPLATDRRRSRSDADRGHADDAGETNPLPETHESLP